METEMNNWPEYLEIASLAFVTLGTIFLRIADKKTPLPDATKNLLGGLDSAIEKTVTRWKVAGYTLLIAAPVVQASQIPPAKPGA
ncbi:protein of unknown function (plasmid) [Pseudodesulfovibrio profundus]|uniref:Uncharacterized protein n=2 Tax=Pseudodesulfovibrio profundus TaxID=57320 RepID=A0A2C8FFV9_9BACT|nr:protein of unknown function [Pseudodesulfovibrio profundus]